MPSGIKFYDLGVTSPPESSESSGEKPDDGTTTSEQPLGTKRVYAYKWFVTAICILIWICNVRIAFYLSLMCRHIGHELGNEQMHYQ